jgi:hypothetical protein
MNLNCFPHLLHHILNKVLFSDLLNKTFVTITDYNIKSYDYVQDVLGNV